MNSIESTSISLSSLKVDTFTCWPLVIFKNTPLIKKRKVSMSRY